MIKSSMAPMLLLALTLASVVTPGLTAQTGGDLIAIDYGSPACLKTAPRGGSGSTLVTLPAGLTYGPLVAGPLAGMTCLVGTRQGSGMTTYVLRTQGATVTTLTTLTGFGWMVTDIGLDDAGDLLVLPVAAGAQNGLYRAPLGSPGPVQRVATWPKGVAEPVAFTECIDTGDWWVLDQGGYLHRLARSGGAVVSIVKTTSSTGIIRVGDLTMDPATGCVIVAAGSRLLRYDPVGKRLTSIVDLGQPPGGVEAMGVHFDQATRGVLFSYWTGLGLAGRVNEYDAAGTFVGTTSLGSPCMPRNVITAWGRAFTPLTIPVAGARYSLRLQSRGDVGWDFGAGLAFSTRPGIATPLGPIPLNPDPLFFLSTSGVPLFKGFRGVLGLNGIAVLSIDLPPSPSLRGLRLFLAAVVANQYGIRRILGPHAFTIR